MMRPIAIQSPQEMDVGKGRGMNKNNNELQKHMGRVNRNGILGAVSVLIDL